MGGQQPHTKLSETDNWPSYQQTLLRISIIQGLATESMKRRIQAAKFCVHSRLTRCASASFSLQCFATSVASGSSGLGALSSAWIDRSTVRICSAGDHFSVIDQNVSIFVISLNIPLSISRQIRPSLSIHAHYPKHDQ